MVLNQEIQQDERYLVSAKVIVATVNANGRPRRFLKTVEGKFLK